MPFIPWALLNENGAYKDSTERGNKLQIKKWLVSV